MCATGSNRGLLHNESEMNPKTHRIDSGSSIGSRSGRGEAGLATVAQDIVESSCSNASSENAVAATVPTRASRVADHPLRQTNLGAGTSAPISDHERRYAPQ
jgi:hypothetical protein